MTFSISRRRRAAVLCSTAIGASLAMGPALAQSSDAARIAALEAQVQALSGQVQALSGGEVLAPTDGGALRTERVAAAISPNQTVQTPPRQGIEGHPFFGDLPDGRTTNVLATGNDKVRLTFSGQINRALNFIDDGIESNVYQVDNENASSRFRFLGETTPLLDTQAVSLFEFEWPYNGSLDVNQLDQSVTDELNKGLNLRLLEVGFSNLTWGSVFIGQGWMASDGTAEIDISGVYNAGWTGHTFAFGGMLPTASNTETGYVDRNLANAPVQEEGESDEDFAARQEAYATDPSNFVNVFTLGNDLDGFSRLVRVRYNSPAFAGFQVSASTATESRYDVALRYAGAWDWGRLAAGISYWTDTRDSGFEAWTGSASLILASEENWWDGISFTLSGAQQDFKERDNSPTMYYGKVAYTTSALTNWGRTGFLVQYGNYGDFRVNDETFDMYGIGVSQNIDQLGAEVYASFNQAQFDNPDIDYNNMNFFQFGTMVRF